MEINVRAIGQDARLRMLQVLRNRLGFSNAYRTLGISKPSMRRYLKGLREIPDDVVEAMLKVLSKEEVESALTAVDRLKSLGLVKEDGSIDYSLASQIIALASRDEYLKNLMLEFVVREYREDLRKMLGISLSGVRLEWSDDFENFMVERKKRKKVKNKETLKYYKNIFQKNLENKVLSEELIEYVVNHENKWVRNVFRHYIQYLFLKRKITAETFGWIMEVVPSRSYKMDVRPYQIDINEVKKTLEFLKQNHRLNYALYRLGVEGGIRIVHALRIVESWNPNETVEIANIELITSRLVVFKDKGFARYYVGLREGVKRCEWAYMSLDTLNVINEVAPEKKNKRVVSRFAKKNNLIMPKFMRKVAWRLMIKAMDREVAKFVQSRFGELSVSEARYEDLLTEADQAYPSYLKLLKEELGEAL